MDVASKKCAHGACYTRPNYGVAGSTKREYCTEHAAEGMVNVVAKMCASDKCRKQPSYGVTGTVKPRYCAAHALEGMVNIVRKRCAQNGCFKLPSYGVTETKKREYCAEHAAEGMVHVASKERTNDGCYGASGMPHSMAGDRKPETCGERLFAVHGLSERTTVQTSSLLLRFFFFTSWPTRPNPTHIANANPDPHPS